VGPEARERKLIECLARLVDVFGERLGALADLSRGAALLLQELGIWGGLASTCCNSSISSAVLGAIELVSVPHVIFD